MLACNKTLTLVHHIKEQNGDRYECVLIPNCSWFSKLRSTLTDRGAMLQRYTQVRFPVMPIGAQIVKGDFIVNGVVSAVSRPSDLEGMEYFTVMDVADNTRGGGVMLPHWAVIGQ